MKDSSLPYRTAIAEKVLDLGPWCDGNSGLPVPDFLSAWDYGSRLDLQRSVSIDGAGLRADTGLPSEARLCLGVRYWSTGDFLRHPAQLVDVPAETAALDLHVEVRGEHLARELVLETSLVLAEALPLAPTFVARRKGSALWRETWTTRLEGTAGVMPTTPIRFTEHGFPAGAAWFLDVDTTRWHAPVLNSLQVFLNVDNAFVKEALTGDGLTERERGLLWSSLRVDLVADLLAMALGDDDFDLEPAGGEADDVLSIRGFVVGLLHRFLARVGETPADAFTRLRGEYRTQPARFRALVQGGLGFPPPLS